MKRLLCIAALAVSAGALAQSQQARPGSKPAESQKSQKPAEAVNWSGPILKATGSGAPDMKSSSPAQARLGAERAAKMDAFRNLLEQAKGIRVSAERTVADEMQREEVRGRVEGVIRGYTVTDKRYFSDQGVELDVEVPLGALADAVLSAPAQEDAEPDLKLEGKPSHTGVIVDASGLKVAPALAPRLLSEKGEAVYSAEAVTPEARRTQGVASYFSSLKDAKKSERVGDKPLVVKAVRAQGSDLVLAPEALAQLESTHQGFLAEGRVAIVSN